MVVAYPFTAPYPQGAVVNDAPTENQFFFAFGEDWIDISTEASLSNAGWMMKALEKEAGDRTWVSLESSVSGEVAATEEIEIDLSFVAGYAQNVTNNAMLIANTNDPLNPVLEYPLALSLNQAPNFMLEADTELIVNENDTLAFNIYTVDMEGDETTFSLVEAYEGVEMTVSDEMISFVYTPDFEDAGVHSFAIEGADEYGNTATFTVAIEVLDVNRAPMALHDFYQINMHLQAEDVNFAFDELITDADGDILSYEYSIDTTAIVEVYISNTSYLIKPISVGTATVTITATDPSGLSVQSQLAINVTEILSANTANNTLFKLYPVPTQEHLNITLAHTGSSVFTVEVVNMVGVKVKTFTVDHVGETLETTIPVADLTAGMYILRLRSENGEWTKTFIKE